jgi:hypothetical protein
MRGITQLTFTSRILENLRVESQITNEMNLYDDDSENRIIGRINIIIRHKSHDLISKVNEDNERIEKFYYDPYEINKDIIKEVRIIDT